MSDDKKSGFSGIFGGLKKMVFTEDYLESEKKPADVNPSAAASHKPFQPATVQPTTTTATPGIITTNIASDDMVQKIYALLEKMNKPGVDFFELWNAAEAMGGVNITNLQNAFTTLKVLGLDKNTVINTGEAYCSELQSKLNSDIQKKREDKESLKAALQNEKEQLQREKQDLENNIRLLNVKLNEATTKLDAVDSKYSPLINDSENKIQSGINALNVVVSKIKTVLEIIKTSVN